MIQEWLEIKPYSEDVFCPELCDKIREKLKLTKKQLPNKKIKKISELHNEGIAEWILNNPDGFAVGNNIKRGTIVISKLLGEFFRKDDEDEMHPFIKKMLHFRYKKNQERGDKAIPMKELNFHYNPMWFGEKKGFLKGMKYDFILARKHKNKILDKVLDGKQYYEWNKQDIL